MNMNAFSTMYRPSMMLVGLLALGLMIPACAFFSNDGPRRTTTGNNRENLLANIEVWESQHFDDYALTYQISCFCPPLARGPFEVVVRDGAVVSVQYEGEPIEPEGLQIYTVDDLFGLLDDAFEREAENINVTYDAELGYPVEFFIDYSQGIADEELGATVLALVPHR